MVWFVVTKVVVQVGLLFWWERKEVMGFLKRALLRSMHA
jgi:hypothetical protein